jgi:hypothetical protein
VVHREPTPGGPGSGLRSGLIFYKEEEEKDAKLSTEVLLHKMR